MGEIHALRVKSPYKLMSIVDIKIENKPNDHGYLYLKCLIDDSINFKSTINASIDDKICVYEELADKNASNDESHININQVNERNSKRLFNGIVQNVRTSNENEVYYLEIQALTSSFELDIKEKSRSFQNVNMTYDELIAQILKDYSGFTFTQNVGKGQKINKPLFQYKETDWNFLKRIVSELEGELFCDIVNINYMFNFGIPQEHNYTIEDDLDYKAFKNLKRFHETGGYNAGYHDTDYFYYEIKRRYILEIGSEISYKQRELYVREYDAYSDKQEIFYKYKLCRKNGLWQDIIYNKLLRGATLEGKVLAVKEELVKLHLDIDENQNEDEAFWFPFLPPSVNIMYSMPLIGESVRLYFPNESSENPMIVGCARKNGEDCEKTAEPSKRYYETEHGSEIAMIPDALTITGGCKDPLFVSFEDNIGVTFTSPKKLSLNAGGEIEINTPRYIKINATSQLKMIKGNTTNGVSIEGEFHITANNVIKNGSCREVYAPYK